MASVPADALSRVWVVSIEPEVDGGRWRAKSVKGRRFKVVANLASDGHDKLSGVVRYRHQSAEAWSEEALEEGINDRWWAAFAIDEIGCWQYTVEAWVDSYKTWRHDLSKRIDANQEIGVELQVGAGLVSDAASRAAGADAARLHEVAETLADNAISAEERTAVALDPVLIALMERYPDKRASGRYERVLEIWADPKRAEFSTWYELFPRSWGPKGRHGTLQDVQKKLSYVADMGFDVLYLPPIHPIGNMFRKGRNNALNAAPEDPGSPWAIGNEAGGHKAVHPELGTLEDLRALVTEARQRGLEVALDVALQASPDHPYTRDHPEWFRQRPDGSIQYAENPPKKYQDIYPFDFECADRARLWEELRSIFVFWIEHGVRTFRVDNPHTKPLAFWEWCIESLRRVHPDLVFLSEAFTRPTVMYGLAKLGFSQSYTYFTWRHTPWEMRSYLEEIARPPVSNFFRPNFWPNTPDILPEHLQYGTRGTFISRLVLAATLSGNYGLYGPVFELMQTQARPDAEEYLNNEKYEIRHWNLDDPASLKSVIARVNQIRKSYRCFQYTDNVTFHSCDNDQLLCFSKKTEDEDTVLLIVVNMDGHNRHGGWVQLDTNEIGIGYDEAYQVHDLLSDGRYMWKGGHNYVELDPNVMPAHVFRVRRSVRREEQFEYFG